LALAPLAEEAAALLACGNHSLLTHYSAAHLWGLLDEKPTVVDVSVVGRRCRPKKGVRVHKLSAIDDRHIRRRDGLPVTSPARTIIDLAADAGGRELERMLAEARVRGLLRKDELERDVDRASGPGTRRLRALLRAEGEPAITRSDGERRMRSLLAAARLQQPKSNLKIGRWEVDFVWPEHRVIVEFDSYRFHGHRAAFERDRRKDMELRDAGYVVIRVTWRQLETEPFAVIAHIAGALARAALDRP
jgi:very-short-patch-repair endonuclease